ncbi:biotin--[acetyl-CoA-carboxylase] ligase [Nocardioides sp. Root140]|uniref:biotin--[acetyl-CoA-carboxylase] ligase n=1 Tax=Nocardioides sp. Root140 TaxID=1736460 RepID=UPI0006F4990F|nr:biotin--[acetyl-CoA-carboxylase] ligase [Nocardioides sp. Root140]KQY56499.1 biotin--acetyl-CoA-carboxylase ligase [Nocardioides sp. Root140]
MTSATDPRPPLDRDRLPASVEILPAVGSTNAELGSRARNGAADGTVVVTEHQTAGRGRLDRVWETPARSALTFSLLKRPDLPPVVWPWIPLATGLAIHTALSGTVPGLGLKWPNDVLVDGRKLAGILVERIETPDGPAAVIGIGLNVSTTRDELPVETATSLALESGEAPDRTDLLNGLLSSLESTLAALSTDLESVRTSYAAACVTVGKDVRVEVPAGEPLTGRVTGIDTGGQLVVESASGQVSVSAGDVIHVR